MVQSTPQDMHVSHLASLRSCLSWQILEKEMMRAEVKWYRAWQAAHMLVVRWHVLCEYLDIWAMDIYAVCQFQQNPA